MALTDGLLAYLKLDEASGTRHDAHGAYDFAEAGTVGAGAGKIGSAADFAASNSDYLSNADLNDDLGATFSLSMWIYYRALPGFSALYDGAARTPAMFIAAPTLGYDSGGYLDFSVPWSSGEWQHLAVVQSGGGRTYYRNGVQTAVGAGAAASAGTLVLGANVSGGGSPWDGLIDEFGAWSRALGESEILALYNGGAGLAYPLATGGPFPHFLRRRMSGGVVTMGGGLC